MRLFHTSSLALLALGTMAACGSSTGGNGAGGSPMTAQEAAFFNVGAASMAQSSSAQASQANSKLRINALTTYVVPITTVTSDTACSLGGNANVTMNGNVSITYDPNNVQGGSDSLSLALLVDAQFANCADVATATDSNTCTVNTAVGHDLMMAIDGNATVTASSAGAFSMSMVVSTDSMSIVCPADNVDLSGAVDLTYTLAVQNGNVTGTYSGTLFGTQVSGSATAN